MGIKKWGNSNAIRLPQHILESSKITADDELEMTAEENIIIIKKVDKTNEKKHLTLKQRLNKWDGDVQFDEWDVGADVGREVVL